MPKYQLRRRRSIPRTLKELLRRWWLGLGQARESCRLGATPAHERIPDPFVGERHSIPSLAWLPYLTYLSYLIGSLPKKLSLHT